MQMTFPSRPRRLAVKLESPSSLDMGDGDLCERIDNEDKPNIKGLRSAFAWENSAE